MGLIHIFVLLGELLKCTSLFYVAGFIYCRSFGRRCKLTRSCLCPPSVSVSAQPALLTPPKRSMLSPSPLTPLKRKQSMISLRTRGNLGMTNLSWQRRSLSQVGWLHINSCRARRNEMKPCQKKKNICLCHLPFQRRCLCVDCVPPSGMMCKRRRSPGRSSWTPTRSSWRKRCRRPGGWCSAYR